MLRKFRESLEKREEGFTLIELLVVVIIIGILAAIAIPVFLNQREKAYKRTAESDARNAALAEESYFSDNNAYVGLTDTGPTVVDLGGGNNVSISDEVTLTITADYNGVGTFCITADHSQTAASPDATYMSDAGGIQDTPSAC